MSLRTKLFKVLPWTGGVNTSKDPAMIPPTDLTQADNIIMGVDSSKKRRDGIDFDWDGAAGGTDSIIGAHDFWYGTSGRTQAKITLDDNKVFRLHSGGSRTTLTDAGTAYPSNVTTCQMATFVNHLMIAVDGTGNTLKQLDASSGFPASNHIRDAGRREVVTLVVPAHNGTGNDYESPPGTGVYFDISSPTVTYRVWFDVDNGNSAPAAGGNTLVEVDIATSDTATTIGDAVVTALEGISSGSVFDASNSSGTVTITVLNNGDVDDPSIGTLESGTAGSASITETTVGSDAPKATAICEHNGRLFANDKENVDLLHYSETANADVWLGIGDSGAFPVRPGDGDPEGITAIASFRGDLIIFKATKIYRLRGFHPELMTLEVISNSIGCIGPNAVADVDGNDLIFVSKRGVHSLQTTDRYGDLASSYVSAKIQRTFNTDWVVSRRKYIHARYLPEENIVSFAVTDGNTGKTNENYALWHYNVVEQAWFRWPDVSCGALMVANDSDRQRLYLGTNKNRLAQTFTGNLNDTNDDGTDQSISYIVQTGFIDVEDNPYVAKAFKNVALVFRPEGAYDISVRYKIDNVESTSSTDITFMDTGSSALLGSTFILGTSVLGSSEVMAAHTKAIEGLGKYIRLRISLSGESEILDLQGFMIEYEVAGDQKEVISSGS